MFYLFHLHINLTTEYLLRAFKKKLNKNIGKKNLSP